MRRQTSSKDVRRQTSLKRDSPTPPCNAKKQKVMEEQTKEPTIRPSKWFPFNDIQTLHLISSNSPT